jgi:hypothetical protein
VSIQQVGRLALRVEGHFWVAYYALPNTMKDAILLGQVQMQFVQDKDRKDAFISLMQEAVSDIIAERTGVRPVWSNGPQPAPEAERSGHA